jgi:hypothetical protein
MLHAPPFPEEDLRLVQAQEGHTAHLLAPVSYKLLQGTSDFVHVAFIYSVVW